MEKAHLKTRLPIALLAVLLAAGLFWLCGRYDNKYTYPAHPAGYGIMELDAERYAARPLLYLVNGWELYQGRLYTPEQLRGQSPPAPDRHLYIGQYGGFDLGDAAAPLDGRGTYRLTVYTGPQEQEYALELVPHYTRWRLWVNGRLVQRQGMDLPAGLAEPAPAQGMAVFRAAGSVEIVLEVENDGGYYGGFVYPPAFGSPAAVSRVLLGRLLTHAAACAAALLVGLLCLLVGFGYRFAQPYGGLFALCLCFCACAAYPVWQALGWQGAALLRLEHAGYYGLFVVPVWLQGRLCGLPKRLYGGVAAAGALLCLGLLAGPQYFLPNAGGLFVFSRVLGVYKWLAGACLLLSSVWAVWRGRRHSWPLLAGFLVLGAAMVVDRLFPLHEPILLGWNVELAGFVLIGVIACILYLDTVRVYREGETLRQQQRLAELQLTAQKRHAELQQQYVNSTRRQMHESRNNLLLLRHYLEQDQPERAMVHASALLEAGSAAAYAYTGNPLVDAILALAFARAREADIYTEYTQAGIPPRLPFADSDLTGALMNLLDNAVEAAARVPSPQDRWLRLDLRYDPNQGFTAECENAVREDAPAPGGRRTAKADKQAHGFGLGLLEETARRNGGAFTWQMNRDSFLATLVLRESPPPEPNDEDA